MHRGFIGTALSLVVALLSLSSCGKDVPVPSDGERCRLVFRIEGESKAPVTAYEDRVGWVDVLVFRAESGTRDAYSHQSGSGPVTADVVTGPTLHWYVIANGPSETLKGYMTEDVFLTSLSLLTHSTQTSLVMHDAGELVAVDDGTSVPVRLDRYACKVTVKSISVPYYDGFPSAPSITLEQIVLVNARGSVPYSGLPTGEQGDLWYNKMSVQSGLPSPVNSMLIANYGSRAVTSSAPISCEDPLYCMPNPVSNGENYATNPYWSPRSTRVAVLLVINGEENWYPIDLPSMQVNRHYILENFTVMGPGSAGPDIPVSRDDVSFTIRVTDWRTADPVEVVFPE